MFAVYSSPITIAALTSTNSYGYAQEDCSSTQLTAAERRALNKHYADLKMEMSIDTKQLSERSQIKALQTNKTALERKLHKLHDETRSVELRLQEEKQAVGQLLDETQSWRTEMRAIETANASMEDKT